MKRLFNILFLIVLVNSLPVYLAGAGNEPLREAKLKLLLKLLTVNQKKTFSEADTLQIEIVYDPSDPASNQEAVDLREIRLLEAKHLLKDYLFSLKIEPWQHFLFQKNPPYAGLILIPGKHLPVKNIIHHAHQYHIFTMSLHPEELAEGVAASITYSSYGTPQIVLNMKSVSKSGVEFGPEILQMVKFYDSK